MIRLYIVEEHTAVRQALQTRLQSSPTIQVVAATAVYDASLLSRPPDIILLGLPGNRPNLKEVGQKVRELVGVTAVITLTAYGDDVEREVVLNAGASQYLIKNIDTPHLIAAIESVANP